MNRKSGVMAAAALLSGAAVWILRRSAAASAEAAAQAARPLSRWEGEGGAPAEVAAAGTPRRSRRRPSVASNRDDVGSTPHAWVFPRA
ncbi:hypothetical protein JOE11_001339 [Robbsia andropogonis]|uniref:hypothetical protein n=1 Tax=Robbsia andropogonis TaxID=28092 RepID=UPI0020A22EF3|nr:hypothetical protein [Robbsia andropogonis]MCP1116669.1 hypothetical protein [Robbsia andropogonis]MCP1126652.1 hypothetical protein [Robbsia andropogonis]